MFNHRKSYGCLLMPDSSNNNNNSDGPNTPGRMPGALAVVRALH